MHNVCTAPYPEVDVFAGNRAIHDTSYDDGWKRKSERDLRDGGVRGAKSRARDEGTSEVVDEYRDGHVECYCNALFEKEGLLEVARVLELGLKGEESDMTS